VPDYIVDPEGRCPCGQGRVWGPGIPRDHDLEHWRLASDYGLAALRSSVFVAVCGRCASEAGTRAKAHAC
jgi:hypothetical protein